LIVCSKKCGPINRLSKLTDLSQKLILDQFSLLHQLKHVNTDFDNLKVVILPNQMYFTIDCLFKEMWSNNSAI